MAISRNEVVADTQRKPSSKRDRFHQLSFGNRERSIPRRPNKIASTAQQSTMKRSIHPGLGAQVTALKSNEVMARAPLVKNASKRGGTVFLPQYPPSLNR